MTPLQRLKKLEELKKYRDEWKLLFYRPYAKQREFHALGKLKRERMFLAGNQLGKTLSAGYETAFHLTGVYPDWWEGKRFTKPVRCWFGSETAELTRDGQQRILLGPAGSFGTGAIPKDLLIETMKARGIPDAVEVIRVRHSSGGISTAIAKAYADGREKWQADTLDFVWYDEEPPIDIYTEGLTRTNAGDGGKGGMVFITETPLKGISQVVHLFLKDPTTERVTVNMTIDDVEHYSAEQKAKVIAGYLPHEREARSKGIPMLGGGRIFPFPEDDIAVDPFELPKHFAVIGGLDFAHAVSEQGHPFGAVKLAWDKDQDVVYVTNAYRVKNVSPVGHASALKKWGSIRWAWPHDGLRGDPKSGIQIAQFYRDEGLDLITDPAQYPDERGNGLEASITDLYKRMESGRFKVFKHLNEWFEEYRMFHRTVKTVNGVQSIEVFKMYDDLISATRYAVMSLHYSDQEVILKPPDRYEIKKHRKRSWMAA